jgi:glycine cleavage system H protein
LPPIDSALGDTRPSTEERVVSEIRKDLRYTQDHEYVRTTDDPNVIVVGITDFAQNELGDSVFVEVPKVGLSFNQCDAIGTIESVKAVSEIFSPVTGEVVAINDDLDKRPELINTSPYDGGWIVKLRVADANKLSGLMDSEAYTAYVASGDK